jgi:hypothetical protein
VIAIVAAVSGRRRPVVVAGYALVGAGLECGAVFAGTMADFFINRCYL